jgi:hypothetical protein
LGASGLVPGYCFQTKYRVCLSHPETLIAVVGDAKRASQRGERLMSQNTPNYYDDQFAHRINSISKPGAAPPTSGRGSSGSGWGFRGVGGIVAVVVIVAIRVLIGVGSSSYQSTYTPPTFQYTPPPTIEFPDQRFDPPIDRFDDQRWNNDPQDKVPDNRWKDADLKDK